ncbi:MAG: hypothetical protein H0U98_18535 [Alphaproteobacteria bacterium]|nr:hypothetical protein [Alphaproteobacteria bacterium]
MSLVDLASIGSFVSGIAVLVSLVYLGLQVRQAKRHQQAAIRQGRADRIVMMCFSGGDPAVADAVAKGYAGADDITETQLIQFHYICRGIFYHFEEEFFQHKEGLANDAYYESFLKGTKLMACEPGLRVQWRQQRAGFVPEFAAVMDKLLAQTQPRLHSDALAQWKAAIAAEKAVGADV